MNTPATLSINGSDLLTHSRMQTYRTCARKHQYQYELGVRPSSSADFFRLGAAVHTGIDVWNKTGEADKAIHDATSPYHAAVMQASSAELANAIELERETVVALLNGYFAAWAWDRHEDAEHPLTPVEIIASELSFDLPITNPETGATSRTFRVAGKIDGIVRHRAAPRRPPRRHGAQDHRRQHRLRLRLLAPATHRPPDQPLHARGQRAWPRRSDRSLQRHPQAQYRPKADPATRLERDQDRRGRERHASHEERRHAARKWRRREGLQTQAADRGARRVRTAARRGHHRPPRVLLRPPRDSPPDRGP